MDKTKKSFAKLIESIIKIKTILNENYLLFNINYVLLIQPWKWIKSQNFETWFEKKITKHYMYSYY